jgi:hypothetical protein
MATWLTDFFAAIAHGSNVALLAAVVIVGAGVFVLLMLTRH